MKFCKSSFLVFALYLSGCFPMFFLRAQEISGPVLRVHSDLVLLDTTVLDAHGMPATGLKKDDFVLLVDGVEKPIAWFDTVAQTPLPVAAEKPSEVLDVRCPDQFGRTPLTIFVLDEVNTHFADSGYARRNLEGYLVRQPRLLRQAAALFVLTDHGLQMAQPFTADRDLLVKALQQTHVVNAWNLERSMSVGEGVADRLAVSLSALEQMAHAVRSLPVHKTMIWLGAGFPSVDPTTLTPGVRKMLDEDLENVTNLMLEARISLDAIDPTSTAAGMTEVTDAAQLAFLSAAGDSSSTLSDPFDKSFDFDRLSPVSGGRVLRGRNDVGAMVDRAVEAGASFYTLGYVPMHAESAAPAFHKIEVKMRRPGLTVMSRQGYYSSLPEASIAARERTQADLNDAVSTQIPMTDLQVLVEGQQGHYRVKVTSDKLHWKSEADGALLASVQIVTAARSAKGDLLAHRLLTETAHARSGTEPEMEPRKVQFAIDFELPADTATLRFVVRDAASGRMGTFDLNLQPKSR